MKRKVLSVLVVVFLVLGGFIASVQAKEYTASQMLSEEVLYNLSVYEADVTSTGFEIRFRYQEINIKPSRYELSYYIEWEEYTGLGKQTRIKQSTPVMNEWGDNVYIGPEIEARIKIDNKMPGTTVKYYFTLKPVSGATSVGPILSKTKVVELLMPELLIRNVTPDHTPGYTLFWIKFDPSPLPLEYFNEWTLDIVMDPVLSAHESSEGTRVAVGEYSVYLPDFRPYIDDTYKVGQCCPNRLYNVTATLRNTKLKDCKVKSRTIRVFSRYVEIEWSIMDTILRYDKNDENEKIIDSDGNPKSEYKLVPVLRAWVMFHGRKNGRGEFWICSDDDKTELPGGAGLKYNPCFPFHQFARRLTADQREFPGDDGYVENYKTYFELPLPELKWYADDKTGEIRWCEYWLRFVPLDESGTALCQKIDDWTKMKLIDCELEGEKYWYLWENAPNIYFAKGLIN